MRAHTSVAKTTALLFAALIAGSSSLTAQQASSRSVSGEGDASRDESTSRWSVSVRAGALAYGTQGNLFGMVKRELTLGRSDFVAAAGGVDVMFRVGRPLELFVSGDWSRVNASSTARGTTVTSANQDTSLESYPAVYGGLHLRLRDSAQPSNKWGLGLLAGLGQVRYRLEQTGVFPDAFDRPDVITHNYASANTAMIGVVGLVLDRRLNDAWAFVLDSRYRRATAGMNGDYAAFDEIDLSGLQFSAGLRLRAGR